MYDDLAKRLRAAGLNVKEYPGWQKNRQSDRAWNPKYVVMHHTAGVGDGLIKFIANGTSAIRGPFSQFLIRRDGTVWLLSAGRANHAGLGGPWRNVPKDSMNSYGWGIEVESRGITADWTPVQWTAAHRTAAVLLDMMNVGKGNILRHKDWAGPRKVDTRYPLAQHVAAVGKELDRLQDPNRGKPAPPKPADRVPAPAPKPVYLKRGSKGSNVLSMQRLLAKAVRGFDYSSGPGLFGPKTEQALKSFQKSKGLTVDGVYGPKTQAALKEATKPKPASKHSAVVEVSNVQPGDSGGDVAVLQWALLSLGYKIPSLTNKTAKFGFMGKETQAAYKQWQKRLGYKGSDADGAPGFASLSALGRKTGLFKAVNK
jgi:peptidoglycan hydrolase-like protein with peptidoglycan-binding domain